MASREAVGGADPGWDTVHWMAALRRDGPARDEAVRRLHALLLRACRAETTRRTQHGIGGAELDDLAQQAADDATVAVLAKLAEFRGDSRFTTWAYKFAILEVSSKLGRHQWRRMAPTRTEQDWQALPDRLTPGPAELALSADLVGAVRRAVAEELTPRQRELFVAVVIEALPLDVVVARYGISRNAAYQSVFEARRKIRRYLVANALMTGQTDGEQA